MRSFMSTLVLVALFHCVSYAQNKGIKPCILVHTLLKQADNFNDQKEYIKALNKLYSARVAARNCIDGNVNHVDSLILEVNKNIIALRQEADAAKTRAYNALTIARHAEHNSKMAASQAEESACEALAAKNKADKAAQLADSSARITEASRLTTLAMQFKEADPTLALQLIKKACDTSYFNFQEAVTLLQSMVTETHTASFYLNKFETNDDDVSSVALSDQGKFMVVGSYAGSISVWNIANAQQTDRPVRTVNTRSGAVLSLATSGDGERIISGSTDGSISVWNDKLEKEPVSLTKHKGAVLSVAISSNKTYAVSSGEDRMVSVWNLTSGALEKQLPLPYGNALQVCFSPGDTLIGIAANDETVRIWNWKSMTNTTLEGHTGAVRTIAFSPDEHYIVSGGDDRTVKVWDLKTYQVKHNLIGHKGSVMSVSFPPNTAYVLSASQDNSIKVWNLGKTISPQYRELRGHQKTVFATGFFNNGQRIYSGSYDRTIKLWDWKEDYLLNSTLTIANQQKRQSTTGNLLVDRKAVSISDTTRFSQCVVTQGSDQTIWLWDSLHSSKPAYIIYNRDGNPIKLPGDNAIIYSKPLFQDFYQKLIKINAKLIPTMAAEDRSRFFRNAQ